jgi:shikimate dehydrogenase
LSPALHRAAYRALGLDWTYDALDVGEQDLPAFLGALGPQWRGLSLTMPLKTAVLPLLDEVDPLARQVAAANTVLLQDGRRTGVNTDVHGLICALREAGVERVAHGVVLGGGATARSALAALVELGERQPRLAVRSHPVETLAAAERLGAQPQVVPLGPAALHGCDVVVSTLPPGAGDALAPHAGDVPVLLDVVYDPWPTPLAAACRGIVVSGHVMLLHQAARQVELMTGHPAPVEAMRAALPMT